MLPARLNRWVVQHALVFDIHDQPQQCPVDILCQQTATQLITCISSPVHVTYTEIKHRIHYAFVVGKGRQTRIHQNGAKSISMKKLRVNNNHYTVHTCFTKTNCTRTCQYCNAGIGITACDSNLGEQETGHVHCAPRDAAMTSLLTRSLKQRTTNN